MSMLSPPPSVSAAFSLFLKGRISSKWVYLIAPVSLGAVLWFLPVPRGLDMAAWHLFAIFVATILAIIIKPFPMGAVALLSLGTVVATKTLTLDQALSSFSSSVVWLVVFAFFISRGFMKTGLGRRFAYILVSRFGHSSLGLGYAVTLTDLILAPAIPSNTARGAGIVFPIVKALAQALGSEPHQKTHRQLGAYLMKVAFHANVVSSAMFVTAIAGNPMILGFAADLGIHLSWSMWAWAALVPGSLCLFFLPIIVAFIFPPDLKKTPQAPAMARQKLTEMGPLSSAEKTMLTTFIGLLFFWIGGVTFGINATTTALLGLAILIISGVLTWEDIIGEKAAWETLIWFSVLLMMASFLGKLGMVAWFSEEMKSLVAGIHWGWAVTFLSLVYFYSHYFFASATAHVSSMFSAFLAVMLACGAPPLATTLLMAFLSSLCAGLTHYGTGTAPIFFGAGYVSIPEWWRVSGILSLYYLAIWVIMGGAWWYAIGYWK